VAETQVDYELDIALREEAAPDNNVDLTIARSASVHNAQAPSADVLTDAVTRALAVTSEDVVSIVRRFGGSILSVGQQTEAWIQEPPANIWSLERGESILAELGESTKPEVAKYFAALICFKECIEKADGELVSIEAVEDEEEELKVKEKHDMATADEIEEQSLKEEGEEEEEELNVEEEARPATEAAVVQESSLTDAEVEAGAVGAGGKEIQEELHDGEHRSSREVTGAEEQRHEEEELTAEEKDNSAEAAAVEEQKLEEEQGAKDEELKDVEERFATETAADNEHRKGEEVTVTEEENLGEAVDEALGQNEVLRSDEEEEEQEKAEEGEPEASLADAAVDEEETAAGNEQRKEEEVTITEEERPLEAVDEVLGQNEVLRADEEEKEQEEAEEADKEASLAEAAVDEEEAAAGNEQRKEEEATVTEEERPVEAVDEALGQNEVLRADEEEKEQEEAEEGEKEATLADAALHEEETAAGNEQRKEEEVTATEEERPVETVDEALIQNEELRVDEEEKEQEEAEEKETEAILAEAAVDEEDLGRKTDPRKIDFWAQASEPAYEKCMGGELAEVVEDFKADQSCIAAEAFEAEEQSLKEERIAAASTPVLAEQSAAERRRLKELRWKASLQQRAAESEEHEERTKASMEVLISQAHAAEGLNPAEELAEPNESARWMEEKSNNVDTHLVVASLEADDHQLQGDASKDELGDACDKWSPLKEYLKVRVANVETEAEQEVQQMGQEDSLHPGTMSPVSADAVGASFGDEIPRSESDLTPEDHVFGSEQVVAKQRFKAGRFLAALKEKAAKRAKVELQGGGLELKSTPVTKISDHDEDEAVEAVSCQASEKVDAENDFVECTSTTLAAEDEQVLTKAVIADTMNVKSEKDFVECASASEAAEDDKSEVSCASDEEVVPSRNDLEKTSDGVCCTLQSDQLQGNETDLAATEAKMDKEAEVSTDDAEKSRASSASFIEKFKAYGKWLLGDSRKRSSEPSQVAAEGAPLLPHDSDASTSLEAFKVESLEAFQCQESDMQLPDEGEDNVGLIATSTQHLGGIEESSDRDENMSCLGTIDETRVHQGQHEDHSSSKQDGVNEAEVQHQGGETQIDEERSIADDAVVQHGEDYRNSLNPLEASNNAVDDAQESENISAAEKEEHDSYDESVVQRQKDDDPIETDACQEAADTREHEEQKGEESCGAEKELDSGEIENASAASTEVDVADDSLPNATSTTQDESSIVDANHLMRQSEAKDEEQLAEVSLDSDEFHAVIGDWSYTRSGKQFSYRIYLQNGQCTFEQRETGAEGVLSREGDRFEGDVKVGIIRFMPQQDGTLVSEFRFRSDDQWIDSTVASRIATKDSPQKHGADQDGALERDEPDAVVKTSSIAKQPASRKVRKGTKTLDSAAPKTTPSGNGLVSVPREALLPEGSIESMALQKRERPVRVRMRPLESWRNERVEYERLPGSDCLSIKNVILHDGMPSPKPKRRGRGDSHQNTGKAKDAMKTGTSSASRPRQAKRGAAEANHEGVPLCNISDIDEVPVVHASDIGGRDQGGVGASVAKETLGSDADDVDKRQAKKQKLKSNRAPKISKFKESAVQDCNTSEIDEVPVVDASDIGGGSLESGASSTAKSKHCRKQGGAGASVLEETLESDADDVDTSQAKKQSLKGNRIPKASKFKDSGVSEELEAPALSTEKVREKKISRGTGATTKTRLNHAPQSVSPRESAKKSSPRSLRQHAAAVASPARNSTIRKRAASCVSGHDQLSKTGATVNTRASSALRVSASVSPKSAASSPPRANSRHVAVTSPTRNDTVRKRPAGCVSEDDQLPTTGRERQDKTAKRAKLAPSPSRAVDERTSKSKPVSKPRFPSGGAAASERAATSRNYGKIGGSGANATGILPEPRQDFTRHVPVQMPIPRFASSSSSRPMGILGILERRIQNA